MCPPLTYDHRRQQGHRQGDIACDRTGDARGALPRKLSVSKERKYYVVWVGKNPGVYDAWPAAQSQVAGHPDARFKSFVSLEEAKLAFQRPWQDFVKPAGPGGGPGKPKSEPKILTEEFLKEIVADQLGIDEDDIKLESNFKEDLEADSLDLFELVMALEEEYGVEIPSEDLEKSATVNDIIEYLKNKGVEA